MNFLNLGRSVAIILMVQFPPASVGQEQSNTSKKAGQQEQFASSRLDTVQLLDYARRLSDDARALEPLDEIPLQTRLADTVWPLDQALAERLLLRSFDLTVLLLKESSEPTSGSSTADPQTIFAQILSIAAKHNATLENSLKDRWQQATTSVGGNGTI